MELTVQLGKNSYPILIEKQILQTADIQIQKVYQGKKVMIISDDQVFPLYGEALVRTLSTTFECYQTVIPHGETSKSFEMLPKVYSALLEARITRTDLIIALGGGVVGDLSGFAAATYLRGVKLVQIPTSLLAQVDSSVGGKVAVDLPQGKNLVGAFYHPKMVLIDPLVLHTLPKRYINDGMGEVIKYGCIKDAALFETLAGHSSFESLEADLDQVIYRCVDIKREIVERDQFDFGDRMLLNFGHTLAHTIEQYYQYERESHGEAVAIGMYQITKMAEEKGLTKAGTAEQIAKVLETYHLPLECHLPMQALSEAISLDKKNLDDKLNIVLLKEIGDSYVYPTTRDYFKSADYI